MSEQLLRAIEKVQLNITQYPAAFTKQHQTIRNLIDPILDALDWHTSDHKRVEYEFPIRSKFVDIALKQSDKPVVLIEAKPLSTQLGEKQVDQIIGYSVLKGSKTAILTNGSDWRVYRPTLTALEDFEDRLLFRLRLDKDDAAESTKKLKRLSYEEINRLESEDIRILLDAYWNEHAREELLKPFSDTLRESLINWSGEKPSEIPSRAVSAWLRKKMFPGRRRPVHPHLPDKKQSTHKKSPKRLTAVVLAGEHIPIRRANEVLIHTSEWLVKQDRLHSDDCPVIVGSGDLYLIHKEPVQPNGDGFRGPKELSNGLFVTTNFGTPPLIQKSRDLLIQFGYPQDM